MPGPIFPDAAQGSTEGMLEDDPNPTLGSNLDLNGHGIVGELDDETLVIDGGLL